MLKKLTALVFAIAMLCSFSRALADNIPIEFHKHGEGQYIYCNNPEFVTEADLSTDENPNPTYMMKNEGLGPDTYYVFFCFYNWTGFDVEPDIEFASDDAVITINSVGYYLPQGYDYWDCIGAWSDVMGINIKTLNNYQQYTPYKNIDLPKTFTLKGNSNWINRYIYNYTPIPPRVTFNMLVSFTIESGTADVNFAALKNYGVPGSRSHHVITAAHGIYKNDTSVKGIETESLPIVEADLDIEITKDNKDGERLPVTVYNQYFPEGNDADFWITNLNPSRDIYAYSKGVTAGSDMLTLRYKDSSKLDYYGKRAKNVNDEWLFDIYHYNTLAYNSSMPWDKDTYEPNAYLGDTLDINNLPDYNLQFNLGNFGVVSRYNFTITNSDTKVRTLNYMLETSVSSNIVIVYDENGNMLNPYTLTTKSPFALCKGTHWSKVQDCMFSVPVGINQTVKYTVDVILPTNCYGGIVNFLVPDTKRYIKTEPVVEFPEYNDFHRYNQAFFNGEEMMKWENGFLYRYTKDSWKRVQIPKDTEKIFDGITKDMLILKTKSGYAAKFISWDEYGNNIANTSDANKIYLFDEKFNHLKTAEFNGFVSKMSCADGKIYAKVGNDIYILQDGLDFKKSDNKYDMPGTTGKYSIFKSGNDFYMNGAKLSFEAYAPDNIESSGGIFYRKLSWKNFDNDTQTPNILAVSIDGVNWTELYFPNRVIPIKSMEYLDNTLYVYAKYETFTFEDVIPKDNIKVKLNNEYLVSEVKATVINDRTMVPLRIIFEKLNATVTWEGTERKIFIKGEDAEIEMQIDNPIAYVNGESFELDSPPVIIQDRTLIPIRFLAENLGYDVSWNQDEQTASIDTAVIEEVPLKNNNSL